MLKNSMLYNFGLEYEDMNDQFAVNEKIMKVNNDFDLVLIIERYIIVFLIYLCMNLK